MKAQSNVWRDLHIGIIILLFLAVSLFHYNELLVGAPVLGKIFAALPFGLSQHAVERFIYPLLVGYASWTLGIKFGVVVLLASAPVMLIRPLVVSPNQIEALVESIFALITGGLIVTYARLHQGIQQQQEELEKISATLRTSEERYQDLFANASDAIWVHDLEGKVVIANRACEKLIGYSEGELVGKDISQFLSPESLSLSKEVKTKLIKGEAIGPRYEQRIVRKDNTEAIVELTTRLVGVDGKPSAFQHIARDATEERGLRDKLHLQIHKTLIAQEEERKRIARELHDDIAQAALLASRRLDILITEAGRNLPKTAIHKLEQVHSITDDIYKSLQRYARDLRPSILDQMGLVAALNWSTEELAKELGIKVEVTASALPPLPPDTELIMFRIAQEALNNIRKHAEASEVSIAIEVEARKIAMTITDNGKGFSTSKLTEDLAKEGKLGVLGMQERAYLIGGSLEIKSEPGKGTTVIAKVPV